MKRSWRNYIKERLLEELRQVDWAPAYHNYDVSKVCNIITKNVTLALDIVAPVVKVRDNRSEGPDLSTINYLIPLL